MGRVRLEIAFPNPTTHVVTCHADLERASDPFLFKGRRQGGRGKPVPRAGGLSGGRRGCKISRTETESELWPESGSMSRHFAPESFFCAWLWLVASVVLPKNAYNVPGLVCLPSCTPSPILSFFTLQKLPRKEAGRLARKHLPRRTTLRPFKDCNDRLRSLHRRSKQRESEGRRWEKSRRALRTGKKTAKMTIFITLHQANCWVSNWQTTCYDSALMDRFVKTK